MEEVKKQDTLDFMGWRPTSRYRVSRPSARRSSQTSQHPVSGQLPVADYPGMIGKAYADLRDLPQRNLDRDHSEIGLS